MGVSIDKKAAKGRNSSTKKSETGPASVKPSSASLSSPPKSSSALETHVRLTLPPDVSVHGKCANCSTQARLRRRAFSEQAWTVLLLWNEINAGAVDQAMCDDCYEELRDILIDRNAEMEETIRQSEKYSPKTGQARLTV